SLEPRARVAGTTVVEEHDAHQELRIGLVLETALVEGALERGGGRVPVLALHVHLGETHVKVAVVRELGGTLERRNRTLELPRRDPAVRELLIRVGIGGNRPSLERLLEQDRAAVRDLVV